MVVKVNGHVQGGVWFSADTAFMTITCTNGDFVDDAAGVNNPNANGLDKVVELLEGYGTVIAITVTSATVIDVIVDYAQQVITVANDPLGGGAANTVVADLIVAIDAIDLTGALPVAGPDLTGTTITNVGTTFAAV